MKGWDMRRLLGKARRPDLRAVRYCDGDSGTYTLADCLRTKTTNLRLDGPGAGRVA
jgi:hypothetical protein